MASDSGNDTEWFEKDEGVTPPSRLFVPKTVPYTPNAVANPVLPPLRLRARLPMWSILPLG